MRHEPHNNGHKKDAPRHRASEGPSPVVMSGIAIGGTTGAFMAGPVGAAVGMVIGGAAGKVIDRATLDASEATAKP